MWKVAAILLLFSWMFQPRPAAQSPATLELLDRSGRPTTGITDGDRVQLRLKIDTPLPQDSLVEFITGAAGVTAATCTLPGGARECTTPPFHAFGWYWSDGLTPTSPERVLTTELNGQPVDVSLRVSVRPRPVVMVHGFVSDQTSWLNYLGPQGYLASAGLAGYAVGDGQVEGVMNTGNILKPTTRTNTIAQNAEILAGYIDRVKTATGAETVDLLGHSMGGLISRFYIDRLMGERDVAQLIMLGTPSAGSDCAILPAALGFYFPTVLEIRTAYMSGVFNKQIGRRHEVPFFAVAGTAITSPVGSPCTATPSDLVVALDSVTSIGLTHQEIPELHINLNTSAQAYQNFVLPLLQRLPSDRWVEPDPPLPAASSAPLQFTRVFTGRVAAGGSSEQTINLEDGLAVASFALYDPTVSLVVQVTGASGRVIELTADQNGLVQVDDPATLVTMGYGFANPAPGPWIIRLSATERTPAEGADYALTAHLVGGAELNVSAEPLLPAAGAPVQMRAGLALAGSPLEIDSAQAIIRGPDGEPQIVPLAVSGGQAQASWQPPAAGFYAIDLLVTGRLADGAQIERTGYLTVEVQASERALELSYWRVGVLLALACLGLLVVVVGVMLILRLRRR